MNTFKQARTGILLAAILALVAVSLPSTASAKDRNGDRIPDKWEKTHRLSLKKDQRKLDQDRDGLRNRGEFRADTDPRDKDSDGDGISDKREKAGIITAYDAEARTLTISLYAGGELSGSVTDRTKVMCEDGSSGDDDATGDPGSGDETESRHRGGDDSGSGSDDESGDESGDDGSGDEADEGEDHRGHRGHRDERGDCAGNCSVENLAVDVEITEAEVRYTAGGTVFKELEIVKAADES